MFEGHYGEHFVIRGLLSNGVSFKINQVIKTGEMVNAGSNRYKQASASPDGKYIILNANNIYSIEYCAAYVEKADEYVLKSDYDKLKQDNDELKAKMAALESKLNGIYH